MKSFIFFLKIVLLIFDCEVVLSNYLSAEEPSSCKVLEPTLPEARLKLNIFCDYEPSFRPNQRNQNTTVHLMLIPKTMDFQSDSNKFTLNSWLEVEWIDEHLKWNPKDFDQITKLHVQSDEIWVPDLSLWNSADLNSDLIFSSSASCLVAYTGLVVCIPFLETTVHCSSDYENWPFEKQTCEIIFCSYFHFMDEITLTFLQQKILMEGFVPDQEWIIVNTTGTSKIDHHILSKLVYEFHLKRHTRVLLTLFVIPIIALMMLTLVILWMDVNSVERIALATLNFLCHLFCLYDLHWQIPENGNRTPHLLVFYQNSLVLSAFTMVLTVILRKLKVITTSSPKWISSVESFVFRYRIARLFVLNDEEAKCFVETEDEAENNAESVQTVSISTRKEDIWKRFAKIIECLSFFSILLIYIIMLLNFIPS